MSKSPAKQSSKYIFLCLFAAGWLTRQGHNHVQTCLSIRFCNVPFSTLLFERCFKNHFFQNEMALLSDALWSQVEGYINARYSECHLRDIYDASVSYQPLRDYISELSDVCSK